MASFKALCLAGVASLVATASAYAADLPLPLPPAPVYAPPAPAVLGGNWYLRGDVGAGIAGLSDGHSTFQTGTPTGFEYAGAQLNTQAIVGGGVGYRFNSFLRADLTGEYRFAGNYNATEIALGCNGSPTGPCADRYGGKINDGVVLVNGYLDLGTYYHVTPYVGAGVGAAFNEFTGVTDYNLNYFNAPSGSAASRMTTQLAFAFMAGIAYDIAPGLKLDIGYRYLDMGRVSSAAIVCNQSGGCPFERQNYHLASNDIRIGLRYTFADFAPVGPAPVLISKY